MMDRKLWLWLNKKDEMDMMQTINGTDPYVDGIDHGVFESYRDEDSSMEKYFEESVKEIWN